MSDVARPGLATWVLGGLLRFRLLVLGVIATVNGLGDAAARLDRVSDWFLFERAGEALVMGHWSDVFAEPGLQVGPLMLAVAGMLTTAARAMDVSGAALLIVASYVICTLGVVWVVRLVHRGQGTPPPPALELGLGLLVIIGGLPMTLIVSGHPSEAIIPLLWVAVACEATKGRPLRAGAWLAVTAAFKPWGLLGLPLLLLAPTARGRVASFAIAGIGCLAFYLPFATAGWLDTFSYEWFVTPWSLVAIVLDPGSAFPWWMRVLQGTFAIGVGVVIVVLLRSKGSVVWVAPLGIIVARLASDPLLFGYYWVAVEILAVVALGLSTPKLRTPVVIPLTSGLLLACYAALLPSSVSIGARFAVAIAFLWAGFSLDEDVRVRDTHTSLNPIAGPV